MSDWPEQLVHPTPALWNSASVLAIDVGGQLTASTGAVWPAANRAMYQPFYVQKLVTAYRMAIYVTTQSGNCDIGIYDENAVRLVSMGSTGVGAAGLQTFNIADTVLVPGTYYAAFCCDNTTANFRRSSTATALHLQTLGMRQQAVGAVTLPNPATFANPASAYVPIIAISTSSEAVI